PMPANANHVRRCWIAAYRVKLASGLRGMKKIPDDHRDDRRNEYQGRNTKELGRRQSQVTARHIGGIDLGGRIGRDNKNQAPIGVEGTQRGDNRRDAPERDDQSIDHAQNQPQRTTQQDTQQQIATGKLLEEIGRDNGSEAYYRTHRQIHVARQHHQRLSHGDDRKNGDREQNLLEIVDAQKTWRLDADSENNKKQYNQQAQFTYPADQAKQARLAYLAALLGKLHF